MKAICLAGALALASACASDDASPGARGYCAQGGELTDCPDTELTTQAVCWRLVDCGAIAVNGQEDNSFDWGSCVDRIDQLPTDRQRLVTECIAASTCDQLRVDGSPNDPQVYQMYCVNLGRGF